MTSYRARTENPTAVLQKRCGVLVGPKLTQSHRITKSFRLERTFMIIKSNRKPNMAKSTTKLCP